MTPDVAESGDRPARPRSEPLRSPSKKMACVGAEMIYALLPEGLMHGDIQGPEFAKRIYEAMELARRPLSIDTILRRYL